VERQKDVRRSLSVTELQFIKIFSRADRNTL